MNRRTWLAGMGLTLSAALLDVSLGVAAAEDASKISLSLNENPFGPSPRAVEAISKELSQLARYNTEERTQQLIDVIAAKEQVSPEQIVLGEILEPLGVKLGLHGGAGGEFIYSVPGYTALVDAATSVGGRAVMVPLDAKLRNDLPAIEAKVNAKTRAVFLVEPHNPSGTVSEIAALKQFLRDVSQRALVIVDEAYLEYSEDFATRSAVDLARAGANVLVFRTLAKVYGLAGLDIGYGIAPKPIADLLRSQGVGAPRSLNRLAVVAAIASLQDQPFVDDVRRKVAVERNLWHQLLRSLKLRHSDAQGNFVFFDAKRPQTEVRAALAQQGIDIGRAFPSYDTWARITIGLPHENARAREAVKALFSSRW
ncbi:pyridoxal phosphate-dependent aminotransferase [Steroidobacter sp.]|uniref:pyridoxal phosphate-dependent aminotransferase n=1 Tax=Steroidobacter sp. TaxID=1978227 RepID=UPI0025EDDDD6|nr:histidinol-phosphate transaminase [Steroidobacter sp.]